MNRPYWSRTRQLTIFGIGTLLAAFAVVLSACDKGAAPATPTAAKAATATTAPTAAATTPTATAVPLKTLKVTPDVGPVGTSFTITGQGFAPGKSVEFVWGTFTGTYDVTVESNKAIYSDRKFTKTRRSLGKATADAAGNAALSLAIPEDFGAVRDIYAVVDGVDVARGGFEIRRTMTISPAEGPVGTPITVTVTGLGAGPWDSTASVLYDNSYTGFVTATTTNGTAVFKIRAAGTVGQHSLRLGTASHALTYFNQEQSPPFWGPPLRANFTVKAGGQVPPPTLDWPDPARVAPPSPSIPRTTILGRGKDPNVSATLSPDRGPIHSMTTLKAKGLPKDKPLSVFWATAAGNDVQGWNVAELPLVEKVPVDNSGAAEFPLQIPDNLGGWHAVLLVSGETIVSEIPFYLERSFAMVEPRKVKAGELFKVEIKGAGWTELDNGVAIAYDNSYVGYACGFCCNGDVSVWIQATGGPGVHIIDLHPMIYDGGHGKWPWQYNLPQLTALQDHPSLQLGYNLPIFRLAVEVVE